MSGQPRLLPTRSWELMDQRGGNVFQFRTRVVPSLRLPFHWRIWSPSKSIPTEPGEFPNKRMKPHPEEFNQFCIQFRDQMAVLARCLLVDTPQNHMVGPNMALLFKVGMVSTQPIPTIHHHLLVMAVTLTIQDMIMGLPLPFAPTTLITRPHLLIHTHLTRLPRPLDCILLIPITLRQCHMTRNSPPLGTKEGNVKIPILSHRFILGCIIYRFSYAYYFQRKGVRSTRTWGPKQIMGPLTYRFEFWKISRTISIIIYIVLLIRVRSIAFIVI